MKFKNYTYEKLGINIMAINKKRAYEELLRICFEYSYNAPNKSELVLK